jgi:hypothetical protein
MSSLLDLRAKSGRPVHKEELRRLAQLVLVDFHARAERREGVVASSQQDQSSSSSKLVISLEGLLEKITLSIRSDPDIWDIFAFLLSNLGRDKDCLECRLKQVAYLA